MPQRYRSLNSHFRDRFGRRMQKIPLDAGFSCPNRDGALSTKGCVFCNSRGSGSGLGRAGQSLAEQWDTWRNRYLAKFKTAPLFMAYLQSFSNTYGPLEHLCATLDQLRTLPDLAALSVGTRPDCLDAGKLHALASFPSQETWLELGLQSAHDTTLARINRGHTVAHFSEATRQAAAMGLNVCAHIIAGLPGESPDDFLATVRFLNTLPITGIKFHNLYVCSGSTLATLWRSGTYTPIDRDTYAATLAQAIALLRPDIIIHRLTGDPAPGELLAPDWAADKRGLLATIQAALETHNITQGCHFA
ncbi:MAG: TIGR01212 family radical SAM protein [Desulfovibrionaceae bacterium]